MESMNYIFSHSHSVKVRTSSTHFNLVKSHLKMPIEILLSNNNNNLNIQVWDFILKLNINFILGYISIKSQLYIKIYIKI